MSSNPMSDIGQRQITEMQGRLAGMEKMLNKFKEDTKNQLEQEKRDKDKMQAELDAAKAEIDFLMKPEFRYQQLGGDDYYYMDLDQYLRVMRKQCDGDPQKLEELKKWEKKVRPLGTKRVIISATVALGEGAVVGIAVVVASHLIARSTLATAAMEVASTLGITVIAASACGRLLIFGACYGGRKIYRWYKAKTKVEDILGKHVNEGHLNSQHCNPVSNLNPPADEADKAASVISVNCDVGRSKYLIGA